MPVALVARRSGGSTRRRAWPSSAALEGGPSRPPEKRRFAVLAALTRLRLLRLPPRPPRSDAGRARPPSWPRFLELVAGAARGGAPRAGLQPVHQPPRRSCARRSTAAGALLRSTSTAARRRASGGGASTPSSAARATLFLISLKAGGTGLNLTAADYVIHLDPWWNPAVEDQATDRAHRIGQTRPVTVYRLRGPRDDRGADPRLHEDKRALVAGVLEGSDGAGRLKTEELAALLEASAPEEPDEQDEGSEVPEVERKDLGAVRAVSAATPAMKADSRREGGARVPGWGASGVRKDHDGDGRA